MDTFDITELENFNGHIILTDSIDDVEFLNILKKVEHLNKKQNNMFSTDYKIQVILCTEDDIEHFKKCKNAEGHNLEKMPIVLFKCFIGDCVNIYT